MAHDPVRPFVVLLVLAVPALVLDCAARDSARTSDADGSMGVDGTMGADEVGASGGGADASTGTEHSDGGLPNTVADTGNPTNPTGPGDGAADTDATFASGDGGTGSGSAKPRVIVMTDIGFDPDDEESLVRYLVYSNEFDTEALIAVTSTYLQSNPRMDLIQQKIDAYDKARPNLLVHAAGFPDKASLYALMKTGQPGYGMASVGPGKSTPGSQVLIAAVDKPDPRPVWVTGWGGMNTLAQALEDVSASRTPADLDRFVAKMRVYTISDQDDAGSWLRRTFPRLYYIVSPSSVGPADYPRATWTGISGDRNYKNGPYYKFDLVDNPWLSMNVIQNHGPLGLVYPPLRWIMEGDTPSYFGLIDNGLGWSVTPSYGGWGGRYLLLQLPGETHPIWTNDNLHTRDTVALDDGGTSTSDQATIWRWREQFQNDFAARMNWCVADQFAKANHNPVAVLNGDRTREVLAIPARGGSAVTLAADGTSDPDGDTFQVSWWIYREASTLNAAATLSMTNGSTTQVTIPVVQTAGTVHVIMEVQDSGNPHLVSYRRALLDVTP